jgi:hypothetical protein
MRVDGMDKDKVGAVRFWNQAAPKVPGRLDNGFAFMGRSQPRSRVFLSNLSRQENTDRRRQNDRSVERTPYTALTSSEFSKLTSMVGCRSTHS